MQAPVPSEHKTELGSLYCADPNCPYCKQLRETQRLISSGQLPPAVKRSA
jgi:hypothetical protein